jgi:ABC-type amino acid transport substrate-binding protein
MRFIKRAGVAMLALALSVPLALTGCGNGSTATTGNQGGSNAPSTSTPAATEAKFVILNQEITTEHYGVGFRLDDSELRDVVEFTLVEMYKDGTVANIAEEFADEGLAYDNYCLTTTTIATKPNINRTTLTVGFDQNFPPYGFVDPATGDFTGFDLKLAAEVAARNNWTVTYQPIDWDAKDLELNSGNIDCIWNGFTIEGRESAYCWTAPYMDNSQVFVVRADAGISTFADLSGKIVMAQADSAALHALEEMTDLTGTFSQLMTTPDYNTAFMELEQGSVDAVAVDLPVANYQISSRK